MIRDQHCIGIDSRPGRSQARLQLQTSKLDNFAPAFPLIFGEKLRPDSNSEGQDVLKNSPPGHFPRFLGLAKFLPKQNKKFVWY